VTTRIFSYECLLLSIDLFHAPKDIFVSVIMSLTLVAYVLGCTKACARLMIDSHRLVVSFRGCLDQRIF
jgi:hypothetical protein